MYRSLACVQFRCLNFFTGLTSLMISQQTITEMKGIDQCVNLEKMWLIETEVYQWMLYADRKAVQNSRSALCTKQNWHSPNAFIV